MQIDSDFEGGSAQILGADDDSAAISLRHDNASFFKQWFQVRVTGAAGTPVTLRIVDAGQATWPGGWEDGYRASASYDGERWFRVPTTYENGELTIRHTPDSNLVAYAAFAPFSGGRYDELLEAARRSGLASVVEIGKSVEGRPMHVVIFGDQGRPARRVWIIAHQHPGETMAGWFMEGAIWRLLDGGDPVTSALLDKATVYLVPRMNPDGCARGNHRTNAAGRDLNREWASPSPDASPEVLCVRDAIEQGGVDLFIDVHGDETIPYVFAFGSEGVPSYSQRVASLEERFSSALERIDGDYQRARGYDADPPGEANLRLASSYIGERFQCLSVGLEMPFKDNANRPDGEQGWSPERSRHFGRSTLEAALACVDALR